MFEVLSVAQKLVYIPGEKTKFTFQGFYASPGDRKWYLHLKMQSVIAGADSDLI